MSPGNSSPVPTKTGERRERTGRRAVLGFGKLQLSENIFSAKTCLKAKVSDRRMKNRINSEKTGHYEAVIVISLASFVNAFLLLISAEANYGYQLGIAQFSPYVRFGATFGLIILFTIRFIKDRELKLDELFYIIIAYMILSCISGLLNNGPSYAYFRDMFAGVTIISSYACGVIYSSRILRAQGVIIKWAYVTLLLALGVLIWSIPTMDSSAYSLSPAPVFLVLDAGLNGASKWILVLLVPIILFSNKRVFILGVSAIIATVIVRKKASAWPIVSRTALGMIFTGLVFLIINFSILGVGVLVGQFSDGSRQTSVFERVNRVADVLGVPANESAESKVPNSIDPVHPSTRTSGRRPSKSGTVADQLNSSPAEQPKGGLSEQVQAKERPQMTPLDRFTSGRFSQLDGILAENRSSTLRMLLGQGFGASYTWKYWSDNNNDWVVDRMTQVDMMPMSFLLTGGVVFATIVSLVVGWRLFIIYDYISASGVGIGGLFAIGFALDALFNFQANAPLFWLMMGAFSTAASRTRQNPNLVVHSAGTTRIR